MTYRVRAYVVKYGRKKHFKVSGKKLYCKEHNYYSFCTSTVPRNQYLTTTDSINCDEATFQALRLVTLAQANSVHCHVVT